MSRINTIQKVFSFLTDDYDFACVLANDENVRFESRRAYLAINHGSLEGKIDVTFGPLHEAGKFKEIFDTQDLEGLKDQAWFAASHQEPMTNLVQW